MLLGVYFINYISLYNGRSTDVYTTMIDSITLLYLLAVLHAQCARAIRQEPALKPALLTVVEHLSRIQPRPQPLAPQTLPVCQHLSTLLRPTDEDPIIRGLLPICPHLAWTQNPNYTDGQMSDTFLANYGYADIVSPQGLIADHDFAVGLLLLGPQTHYPPHHHPAEELYYTVSGKASWWQPGQEWTNQGPGAYVHHRSGVAHAMQTARQPVCLLYMWWGQVTERAQFIR